MSGRNPQKLHQEVKSQINKPRGVDDDKELFVRFKKGLEWKDESFVKHCSGCSTRFTMVTRKHHCRECGDVFCNACSSYQIVIQGALKRCCTACYRRAVTESNQTMTGNHINMDYDYPVSVGEGSFASQRSTSFAKAVHLVESLREKESPSPGRRKSGLRSSTSTPGGSPSKFPNSAQRQDEPKMEDFPPWVDALVYVAMEGEESVFAEGSIDQVARRVEVYPSHSLPLHVVQDISNAAIPSVDACQAALGANAGLDILAEKAVDDEEGLANTSGDHVPRIAMDYTTRTHDKSKGGLVGIPSQDTGGMGGSEGATGGKHRLDRDVANGTASASVDAWARSKIGRKFQVPSISSTTLFYNVFVCFRELKADLPTAVDRGTAAIVRRHALVLVSKWPFPQLAHYSMKRLDETFQWSSIAWCQGPAATLSSSLSKANPEKAPDGTHTATKTTTERLDQAVVAMREIMSKAFGDLNELPRTPPGELMQGGFLGESLLYRVPSDIAPLLGGVNLNFSAAAAASNLVQSLAPLGLIQHLLTLWNLVVTGKDVVVLGETPAQSSELIMALSSLLSPLGHNGLVYPYLHAQDSDIPLLRALSKRKQARTAAAEACAGGSPNDGYDTGGASGSSRPSSQTDLSLLAAANDHSGGGVDYRARGRSVLSSTSPSTADGASSRRSGAQADALAAAAVKKHITPSARRSHSLSSILVGVTEPSVLDHLDTFDAAIFLSPNHRGTGGVHRAQSVSRIRESLRKRNRAPHISIGGGEALRDLYENWCGDSAGYDNDDASAFEGRDRGDSHVSLLTPRGGASDGADHDGEGSVAQSPCILLTRGPPAPLELDRGVLKTIQNMTTATSMRVMGDKLLRDRLDALTMAYFTSNPAQGSSVDVSGAATLEVTELRISAMERATRAEEKRIADKIRTMISTESNLVSAADIRWLVVNTMGGMPFLIPTLLMYICYVLALILFLFVLETRVDILACAILIGNFPVRCPKKWERVMRLFLPSHILYPAYFDKDGQRVRPSAALSAFADFDSMRRDGLTRHNSERSSASEDSDVADLTSDANRGTDEVAEGPGSAVRVSDGSMGASGQSKQSRANLSGVWSRTSTVDYDKFLIAQGAGWVKARLASSIALTHTITMDEDLRFFRLAEKGGPIDTDQLYTADGETVHRTTITEAVFDDTVYHDEDNVLVIKKVLVTKDRKPLPSNKQYTLIVKRILDDASHLRIVATYHLDSDTSKNVTATSYFEKTGPSPKQEEMDAHAASSATGASVDGGAQKGAEEKPVGGSGGDEGDSSRGQEDKQNLPAVSAASDTAVSLKASSPSRNQPAFSPLPESPSGHHAPSPEASPPHKMGQNKVAAAAGAGGDIAYVSPATTKKRTYSPDAFQGVWHRSAQMNYDEILIALGMKEKLRGIALDSDMTVTIAVNSPSGTDATSGGRAEEENTYIRVRECTGGLNSTSSGLNVDSTFNITPDTSVLSRNNKKSRRDSTRAGGTKIMDIKFFESSTYGEDSTGGGSGSAKYPHGDVLSIYRRAVNNRLQITSRYFLIEKNGKPQLRLTTTCTQNVPQFKGGPIVEVSTEATTLFELASRTPEAGFEAVAPSLIVSDSLKDSITRAYSETSFSQPSAHVASSDSGTPSVPRDFTSSSDFTEGAPATEGNSGTSRDQPDSIKRKRLISGMWVHASSTRRGSISAISTLNMQEILFNASMTKMQIGDIRNPSRTAGGGTSGAGEEKDRSVVRTMYKIDPNRTTTRMVDVDGESVEVEEACFWDESAVMSNKNSGNGTTALIIRQKDNKNQRETTIVRYVERGDEVEDESTAVDGSGRPVSHSRIYTTLRVVRLEKDLGTGAVIESENTYKRRRK